MRPKIPGRYLLLLVTVGCIALIAVTYNTNIVSGPLNRAVSFLVVPFQNGVSKIGSWMVSRKELLEDMDTLRKENTALKEENASLEAQVEITSQQTKELAELRQLYELDGTYAEYDKTGARIIAKDSGNYYHSFIIDKGTDDGIKENMNVLSGAGLVGRITSVGTNWARVETIIDDNSNVASEIYRTGDALIACGDLQLYSEGVIRFERLNDPEGRTQTGDRVVTSNISDNYLPGILIGYVQQVQKDPNNLTYSGQILPAVDFHDLDTVLVVLETKQQVPDTGESD